MSLSPNSYEEWKHCITVDCGIPLTPGFISERIEALTNRNDFHTQKFIESWGVEHHAQTLGWFHHASEEIGAG